MATIFWIAVFLLSMFFLVKSADYLVDSAKQIGIYFSLPSFIVGVLIVGIGTSAPELASSIFAALQGVPEMVVSNAIGSNIANVLLIVGLSSILARNIKISKELIDLDIPLLLLSTGLFVLLSYDALISRAESAFLLSGLLFYLTYTISSKKQVQDSCIKDLINIKKEFIILFISLFLLIFSAKYLVLSVVELSNLFNIAVSAITLLAVALGTSLPELFVSVSSIKKGESDMALGNIFGSNAFNLLAVVGIPSFFTNIPVDNLSLSTAFPVLILSTLLFAFSGISKRIHAFEGIFFLIIYVYFVMKVFNIV